MDKGTLQELEQLLAAAPVNGTAPDATWLSRFATAIQALGLPVPEHAEQLDLAIQALTGAVFAQTPDARVPIPLQSNRKLVELYAAILELRQFALALAEGDLSQTLRLEGFTAGALKSLQANLRHLTRQTQMIAAGDLSQRVEFMGEFSDAFNAMVARLEETLVQLMRDEIELTQRATDLIGEIAERKRAEEAEHDLRMMSEALRDTATVLNSTLDLNQVLDHILENVERVVAHDAANIMLFGEDGFVFAPRGRGYTTAEQQGIFAARFKLEDVATLHAIATTTQPLVIADTRASAQWSRTMPGAQWIRSYAGVPILIKGQVIGFLNLDSATPGHFTFEYAERLQAFAAHAALAIENARLYAEVQRSAITDPLTGIFNRRHLIDVGAREFERARRYKRPFSILLLDLDHFKTVNDSLGHAAGDRVLQIGVARLLVGLRLSDVLGRYGGEEFIALLPETDQAQASKTGERLRERIASAPIESGRSAISVTVSVGISAWEDKPSVPMAERFDELIEQADQALYQAKAAGRNRVALWNSAPPKPKRLGDEIAPA